MFPFRGSNKCEQVVRNCVPSNYLMYPNPPAAVSSIYRTGFVLVSDQIAIEQQLDRITASDEFRKCPQLLRFLRFAVSEALSGRDGGSKERLIGMEVFGRPADYDAGSDPVARVEARRLRRKLTEYYSGAGREDPIEICLPKGGYLPTFEARISALARRAVAV